MKIQSEINDEKFKVWQSMLDTVKFIGRFRQKELKKFNISPSIAQILGAIKTLDNYATPTQIARLTIRQPQSISGTLTRLEKLGVVIKHKDPDKKSVLRISLSEKGEEIFQLSTIRKSIDEILSILSPQERQILRELNDKIKDRLMQEFEKHELYGFAKSFLE